MLPPTFSSYESHIKRKFNIWIEAEPTALLAEFSLPVVTSASIIVAGQYANFQ